MDKSWGCAFDSTLFHREVAELLGSWSFAWHWSLRRCIKKIAAGDIIYLCSDQKLSESTIKGRKGCPTLERNLTNRWKIIEQINKVQEKYRNLKYWQNIEGDFVLEGLLEFDVEAKGHHIQDAFEVRIIVPINYPDAPARVFELAKRIPPDYPHINSNRTLCLGTDIEIQYELSDDNSLLQFVEQILIRNLFGFAVWEKTGIFPFGERKHFAPGLLEFYQNYFNVKDCESAKRLLYYLSRMKRYSRNKWCPCRSGKRIRKCHGDKIKKLISVSSSIHSDISNCRNIIA
jgi:hypothetical protein